MDFVPIKTNIKTQINERNPQYYEDNKDELTPYKHGERYQRHKQRHKDNKTERKRYYENHKVGG